MSAGAAATLASCPAFSTKIARLSESARMYAVSSPLVLG